MKLIIELKRMDDKWEKHVCNDFPSWSGDFVTLYKTGFKREMIPVRSIAEVRQSFKA